MQQGPARSTLGRSWDAAGTRQEHAGTQLGCSRDAAGHQEGGTRPGTLSSSTRLRRSFSDHEHVIFGKILRNAIKKRIWAPRTATSTQKPDPRFSSQSVVGPPRDPPAGGVPRAVVFPWEHHHRGNTTTTTTTGFAQP